MQRHAIAHKAANANGLVYTDSQLFKHAPSENNMTDSSSRSGSCERTWIKHVIFNPKSVAWKRCKMGSPISLKVRNDWVWVHRENFHCVDFSSFHPVWFYPPVVHSIMPQAAAWNQQQRTVQCNVLSCIQCMIHVFYCISWRLSINIRSAFSQRY